MVFNGIRYLLSPLIYRVIILQVKRRVSEESIVVYTFYLIYFGIYIISFVFGYFFCGSYSDLVLGVNINGDIRAYPLQIMVWHEIVNDKVGGIQ